MPPQLPATGESFIFYGTGHLVAIAATCVASAVLVCAFRRPGAARLRRAACYGLAGVLVGSWVVGEIEAVVTHTWLLGVNLPLHLCDIGAFVTAAALFAVARGGGPAEGAGQRLYELAYFWGLGGALQAILTPDLALPFPDSVAIRFFIGHGGIVAGVLALTIGLGMRPRPGSPVRVWLLTTGLAGVMLVFDWLAGVNYMYMMGPPLRPSLFDYFGPWPWSLITLVAVGAAFVAVLYSPFWVWDRLRRRGG